MIEDIAEFEAAGADDVLSKPMRVECLDKIVQYFALRASDNADCCSFKQFISK